ncbi:hypothetical protein HO173_005507 [Letharia columbiana]|uniref:Uncharacterized protein n=1 Tax=Letharia columbiana TaxID=112416 RepID=A0A8H6FXB3_9LECA|nr:uncharacterized protein HO173_005507 [Letharia columbiana]KAF6236415.1 hypothetical protein HO173_005507 [Letharia columbiana]
MVVLCVSQSIFLFTKDPPGPEQDARLKHGLQALINRLKHNGVLIIIDIEKNYDTKPDGSGSKEIIAALKELGMEDVGVMKDQHFQWHAKDETGRNYQNARADVMHAPMEDREEMFLILRATRGKGYLQAGEQR